MGKVVFDILVGLAVIAGTAVGAATLYYTAAIYYGWKPTDGVIKAMSDWKFIVLGTMSVVVILSTWGLVAVRLGWVGSTGRQPYQFLWTVGAPTKFIAGKHFLNEKVPLDGISYRNCTFQNVTFVFNGTHAFEFTGNTINGAQIVSENPAINGTLMLLRGIGFLSDHVHVVAPPGVRAEPPTIINTPSR